MATKLAMGCVRNPDQIAAMMQDLTYHKRSEQVPATLVSRLDLALEFSELGARDLDPIHDKAWCSLKVV